MISARIRYRSRTRPLSATRRPHDRGLQLALGVEPIAAIVAVCRAPREKACVGVPRNVIVARCAHGGSEALGLGCLAWFSNCHRPPLGGSYRCDDAVERDRTAPAWQRTEQATCPASADANAAFRAKQAEILADRDEIFAAAEIRYCRSGSRCRHFWRFRTAGASGLIAVVSRASADTRASPGRRRPRPTPSASR
jgi:hypothetical protein